MNGEMSLLGRSLRGLTASVAQRRLLCGILGSVRRSSAAPLGPSRGEGLPRNSGLATCARAAAVEAPHAAQAPGNGAISTQNNAPTFQEAIARLQEYWASVGCAVWLPHNTEVGAGTMNPATFLRVLGPEPWNVRARRPSTPPSPMTLTPPRSPSLPLSCYAEPSIRPDDSRYGDNPNRVQRHTQFQARTRVILKPDPGNPQELYLGSLEALGIDTRAHDVRFVEDNWESPVLGAWGLGWEWPARSGPRGGARTPRRTARRRARRRLRGPLAPPQAGGKTLEVPAVEITYGMERIIMALQGAKHFKDIRYTPDLSYGEMFLQARVLNEYEMSVYNLDEADVEGQRRRFDLYDQEARRMLARRLPVPAYDHLLKLSHTFNLLDARGAVGVTERAACFATMRALAREVTALWLARREEQGYPLGLVPPPLPPAPAPPAAGAGAGAAPATLVLEIGSEELPPEDVAAAMEQLKERVLALLERLRLGHGGVRVDGTPRRLAVIVHELAGVQDSAAECVRGPPAKVGADDYLPTLAAARITLSLEQRKAAIWDGVQAAARGAGGAVPDGTRGELLDEVANLVESPTVVLGGFDPAFLALPREARRVVWGVLVMVMRKHQRYFPVVRHQSEELLPHFVTVANGEVDVDVVRAGNEAVLRARFEDAQFFYNADLQHTLEAARPRLAGTLFQKDLGSLLDKSGREAAGVAAAAARLCKADLATSMVTEMTALAGTMGRHYALREGQDPAVAEAIFESVLPRQAGDALPSSTAGILVSVADKLDSLVGLLAAGCGPTATADPYGLRRAAVGLLQTLIASDTRLDLPAAVDAAAALQPMDVPPESRAAALDFLERRLEQLLVDGGTPVEAVRAALGERGRAPALAARTAREVGEEMRSGEAGRLYQVRPDMSVPAFLEAAEALIAPLDAYFDKARRRFLSYSAQPLPVFVMAEDPALQRNRLALLRDVAALPRGILDLSQLPGF
eukprot:scaffold22.g6103.t1